MQRITVVGTPGAGKTTLAQTIAAGRRIPFIELDALFWGPNWTPAAPGPFRAAVTHALATPQWAVGGNYSVARDIIWQRADTLVWLDYPLPLVFARLLRRTVQRIWTKERLWAGNYETWQGQFLQRDSLLLFALQTHHRRRKQFMAELIKPTYNHLTIIRWQHPTETDHWLPTQVQSI